jgi:hypothetical protein
MSTCRLCHEQYPNYYVNSRGVCEDCVRGGPNEEKQSQAFEIKQAREEQHRRAGLQSGRVRRAKNTLPAADPAADDAGGGSVH